MSQKIYSDLDVKGTATINSIPSATSDTDKFLVSDGGLIKYRTGNELLSDLGIGAGLPTAKVQHVVKAAVAINKGQAIYISGSDGTNMLASLASNNSEATSSKTMGLLDATVAINGFANVVTEGLLAGLNTSTAVIGDPVWLGTNGNLIYGLIGKPYAPAHLVFIGIVTRVNISNGEIFVKAQNGFELDEIHDIDLKTTVPVNGHILGFNGTLWVNKTIAGWLGYTPADDANVVHKTGNEVIDGIKTFNAGSINIGDQIIVGIGTISKQNNIFVFTGSDGFLAGSMQNGNISVYNNNTYGSIQANLLTNNRNYTLPNASGTIALTSDVSALGALKQDKLTGPGFVKANSGVITYDNSTYLTSAVTTFSGGTTGLFPNTASSGMITLGGTLAITNGGTGATTAPLARTSLGATTVGSNIFTAANPNAITFLRANANNTVSFLDAAAFRTAIGVSTGGTITLSAIGVTPNLNGATITGSVLNLEPASIGFGGVVTTTIQTFAGEKTFVEDLKVNSLTIGKGGAIGNTAVNNTAIGIDALKVNTANNNTAIGKSALANNVGGYQNTAIGVNALLTNVGESSIVNPTIPFVGIYNTAVGFEALKLNTGNNNTALGLSTLLNNTIGFQNTAIGSEALRSNVDGEENTAVGKDALRNNADANWNTAVGSSALSSNFGGYQNTAVGRFASFSNSSGAYNTSIGVDSLKDNTISNYNTGLGYKAGYTVTGAKNTFLGSQDDFITSLQVATVINSVAIGYNAYTTKNNQVVLGNSLITETVLNGVIKLTDTPITSIGAYDIITRNTTSGNIEKITGITKSMVGLSNVDNTSDLDKPISTATQTALNTKQNTLSGTGLVKSTAGTISYATDNSGNWNTAYTNRITSLTVTGSSGAATLISNVLNIPTYTLTGLGGQPLLSGTGFVKSTAGTISYDTNTYYLASNPSGYQTAGQVQTIADAKVVQTITDGVTATAPSQNAVFDALATKQATLVSATNIKTINGTTILGSGDLVVSGGGSITLSAIGAVPNANGATITGSVLNLQPASASFGGVVTNGAQTFSTGKTFTDNLQITTTSSTASIGLDSLGSNVGTISCNSSFYQFNAINSTGYLFKNSSAVNTFTLNQSGNATFLGSATATGFFNSSDSRLKDVLERDGDAVKFTWKDGRDDKIHIGYIAQEVQKTYPDQVSEDTNGMLTVNYIEVLVAKIQELENRIKQLEK